MGRTMKPSERKDLDHATAFSGFPAINGWICPAWEVVPYCESIDASFCPSIFNWLRAESISSMCENTCSLHAAIIGGRAVENMKLLALLMKKFLNVALTTAYAPA